MRKLLLTDKDLTLAIARIVLAIIFFAHGSQKVLGWFGGRGIPGTIEIFQQTMGIPVPLTVMAMAAEFLGSLGLFFGFLSRVAAAGVLVVMIVAPIANGLFPQFFMNWTGRAPHEGFEYHLLAIALIITIIIRGGGSFSVDRALVSNQEWSRIEANGSRKMAAHRNDG